MISRFWKKLLERIAEAWKAQEITLEQSRYAARPEDQAAQEVRHIMNQLHSIPGLWEELSKAALIGRPECLRRINAVVEDSGLRIRIAQLENDGTEPEWLTIYSEHHAATQRIGLPLEDSLILATIIWALEGMSLKRQDT